MELETAQEILNAHGFPCGVPDGEYGSHTREALQHFQLATTRAIITAGGLGPREIAALKWLPKLSPHFTVSEVRSKGNGNCYIRSPLLHGLESLRTIIGRPVVLVNGYRDPVENKRVGGASRSLHMWGLAVDVASLTLNVPLKDMLALELFSGIGWNRSTGLTSHVDMRHLTGYHYDTPRNPEVWRYNR